MSEILETSFKMHLPIDLMTAEMYRIRRIENLCSRTTALDSRFSLLSYFFLKIKIRVGGLGGDPEWVKRLAKHGEGWRSMAKHGEAWRRLSKAGEGWRRPSLSRPLENTVFYTFLAC